jgi:uncharacterized membrane protein
MTETDPPVKQRPRVLLIASLCLNVALAGLIVMTMMRFRDEAFEKRGHKRELGPQAIIRIVPAERDKIRTILDSHRPRIRALRAAAMDARDESMRLLASPEFSAGKFASSLAAVEKADADFQSEIVRATSETVAILTPEERKAVAEKVRRPGRSWLKRLIRRH